MERIVSDKRVQASLGWLRSSIIAYIGGLFLLSRFLYISLGDVVIRLFDEYMPTEMATYHTQISKHLGIQMWYVWDAVHYTKLAELYNFSVGRLTPMASSNGHDAYYLLHWFPLYPVMAKILHEVTRISLPYCQLIISNAALLGSLYLLYKLLRFDGTSERFARKAVALLLLLPTSFIFSAGMSESLFLLLALVSLYKARQQRWLFAGVAGFLVALTHPRGFLMSIPLIVEAYQQYGLKPKELTDKLRPYLKPMLACVITCLGLVAFLAYSWLRTGDIMAYVNSQHIGNNVSVNDPFTYVLKNLFKLRTLIILGELALVALAWKKLRWSYVAYALVFTLAVLSFGTTTAGSMLRYESIVFPVAIAAAHLTERKEFSNFVWVALGILNGALFIMWVVWWTGFII